MQPEITIGTIICAVAAVVISFMCGHAWRDWTSHKEWMALADKAQIIMGFANYWHDKAMEYKRIAEADGEEWKLRGEAVNGE